ncbi:MAG: radical SAM protein, partial [Phycisphaerae bacterium]|nr:radical SAM protein [Phycisphaerae bacterium]
ADFVMYQRKWNPLSPEHILEDLTKLKKDYDYDSVRFYDSNMFASEKRTREICEGVLKKNLNFKWLKCNGDAFALSRYSNETLNLMKKAGVSNVLIGVESGYAPALKCISKNATIEQNVEATKRLHRYGISITFSFMFGFPYDLPEKQREKEHENELAGTMKTIARLSDDFITGDHYHLFVFTPYPGVSLYDRYIKLGWKPPEKLEDWNRINLNESNSCPWVSSKLIKLYKPCLRLIWFFTHKLERRIFPHSKNPAIRKYASRCDSMARKRLAERVERFKFKLPLYLWLTWLYYRIRDNIMVNGLWLFIKKAISKAVHRS